MFFLQINYLSSFPHKENREEAVNYALEYTDPQSVGGKNINYYNSEYDVYIKDCTNFVSQVLHAGGWKLEPNKPPESYSYLNRFIYSKSLKYWFHVLTREQINFDSWTWVNADYFYQRLKKYENSEKNKL